MPRIDNRVLRRKFNRIVWRFRLCSQYCYRYARRDKEKQTRQYYFKNKNQQKILNIKKSDENEIKTVRPASSKTMFMNELECQINNTYTEKEIKNLYNMLISSQKVSSIFHLKFYYSNGRLYQEDISHRAFMLITKPLVEMPLYVNDEDRETQIVAVWRLKTGK